MKILKALLGYKDINVTGNMKVNSLQAQFKEQYGVGIRIYRLNSAGEISTGRGAKLADGSSTLASVAKGKVSSITIKKSMTVQQVEDAFANNMGIGVQVEDVDGKLAPNSARISDLKTNN